MSLSTAQYLTNYNDRQTRAKNDIGTVPARSLAWSQMAGVWGLLYQEQSKIDKENALRAAAGKPALTVTAAATAFRDEAEVELASAYSKLTNAFGQSIPQALARNATASNAAYMYFETVKVDNMYLDNEILSS